MKRRTLNIRPNKQLYGWSFKFRMGREPNQESIINNWPNKNFTGGLLSLE